MFSGTSFANSTAPQLIEGFPCCRNSCLLRMWDIFTHGDRHIIGHKHSKARHQACHDLLTTCINDSRVRIVWKEIDVV